MTFLALKQCGSMLCFPQFYFFETGEMLLGHPRSNHLVVLSQLQLLPITSTFSPFCAWPIPIPS